MNPTGRAALRRALARLLWDSVADNAACTCERDDRCPQCEAMAALGFGRWRGAKHAQNKLATVTR